MKKSWMAIVFGSMLVLSACGGEDESTEAPSTAPDDAATEEASADPEQLVQQSCISCHGANLEGAGNFPALNDVGSRLSEEEIHDIIINGKGGMPPRILEGEDAEVVAAYLASLE